MNESPSNDNRRKIDNNIFKFANVLQKGYCSVQKPFMGDIIWFRDFLCKYKSGC